MKKVAVLAADFGATSGRVMRFSFDGERLYEEDTYRFVNSVIDIKGHAYWNVLSLFQNLKDGLAALIKSSHNEVLSAGIDTWGCDFGLLDKNGAMLGHLMSYRDPANKIYLDKVLKKLTPFGMYKRNGIANMPLNGVYQLARLYAETPNIMKDAKTLLMIPDYFTWLLTGEIHNEYTALSSAQFMNGREPDVELLESIGIESALVGQPAATYGKVGVCEAGIDIISVPGHDTAAAAVPVKTTDERVFISSGTWMMFGAVIAQPRITESAMAGGYSNYGGAENNTVLVRDITGLYLLAECRKRWKAEGKIHDVIELEKLALKTASWLKDPATKLFNPDDPSLAFTDNMPAAITALLGGGSYNEGEITRIIIESIARECAHATKDLSAILGKTLSSIYVVGGGTRDNLLIQSVADATGIPCVCGPAESAVLGNVVTQLTALGHLKNFDEGRELIACSYPERIVSPNANA